MFLSLAAIMRVFNFPPRHAFDFPIDRDANRVGCNQLVIVAHAAIVIYCSTLIRIIAQFSSAIFNYQLSFPSYFCPICLVKMLI